MEYYYLLMLPVTVVLCTLFDFIAERRYHHLHDRLLMMMLAASGFFCYVTLRTLDSGTCDRVFILLDNLETFVGLSVCPLLFLYMRTVAHDAHWHQWYIWLFVPSLLFGTVGSVLSIEVGWHRIQEARGFQYAPFIPESGNILEHAYHLFDITLFNLTLEVMAVVLIGWSIFYLVRYHRHAENYYANLKESTAHSMGLFLVFTILLMLTIMLLTIFYQQVIGCSSGWMVSIAIWLSIVAAGIGWYGYRIEWTEQQQVMLELQAEETAPLPEWSNELTVKVTAWTQRADKPYCCGGLTLADMADDLQISPRMLSTYINSHEGKNFNRWINNLRVEEAVRMLSDNPEEKIAYISAVCGFSDPASFSRTFRLVTGISPQNYRNMPH